MLNRSCWSEIRVKNNKGKTIDFCKGKMHGQPNMPWWKGHISWYQWISEIEKGKKMMLFS